MKREFILSVTNHHNGWRFAIVNEYRTSPERRIYTQDGGTTRFNEDGSTLKNYAVFLTSREYLNLEKYSPIFL